MLIKILEYLRDNPYSKFEEIVSGLNTSNEKISDDFSSLFKDNYLHKKRKSIKKKSGGSISYEVYAINTRGLEFLSKVSSTSKSKSNANNAKKKIFVSHAYNDRKIAERIINILLVETLDINKSDIFFTSKRETGIRSSKTWREQIRKNLIDCQLFIALITPSYHKSQMCQAELGAAWVNQKSIYSLYLAPITVKNFSVVIAERQADNIRLKEEMQSFVEQFSEDFTKHYSKELDLSDLSKGFSKFYKSLRLYLRKNAEEIGIEYNDNSHKKTSSNNLEIPKLNIEVIRYKAKSEYPNDFSMQEYLINEQRESHNILDRLIKKNSNVPEFKIILENAIREWQDDYSMIVSTIEDQLDSLSRLK